MAVIFKKAVRRPGQVKTQAKTKYDNDEIHRMTGMDLEDSNLKKKTIPSIKCKDILSEDGCYHVASPIWTERKAPIPAGIINFPKGGLKVRVDWKDVQGEFVFPGVHLVSKEEYLKAPEKKTQEGFVVKYVDCKDWIRL